MAQFIGGPYDGYDLPIDTTQIKQIRLPEVEHFNGDPEGTKPIECPYLYVLDNFVLKKRFRYEGTDY